MLRGLYTAASGMISQQRRHDTITNNIANIETPGYKQKNTALRSFNEMLLQYTEVDTNNTKKIGTWTGAVLAEEALTYFQQGNINQTFRSGDFAIVSNIGVDGAVFDESGQYKAENGEVIFQPQAYFTVVNNAGEVLYTRGGQFTVNSQGELLTGSGERVLGANNQPIVLPAGVSMDDIVLGSDARLLNAMDGTDTGLQLLISRVDNPNQLVRVGDGSFKLPEGVTAVPVAAEDSVQVMQGFVEQSNVDMMQASVDLMAAQRAYEINSQIVKYYDQTLQKAVNEIGRIN